MGSPSSPFFDFGPYPLMGCSHWNLLSMMRRTDILNDIDASVLDQHQPNLMLNQNKAQ
jgi:hypothetical protein